jgi:hypothetical protein
LAPDAAACARPWLRPVASPETRTLTHAYEYRSIIAVPADASQRCRNLVMMPLSPLNTLGKLLVIWGGLLPLITLPSTAFGPRRIIALLDVSLSHIDARIGPLMVAYKDIIVGALILTGLRLSFMVPPERVRS